MLILIIVFFLIRKRKKNSSELENQSQQNSKPKEDKSLLVSLKDSIIPSSDIQIESKLGEGNFGEVYKANWSGTFVAVKKLKGDEISQFEAEATKLAQLNHPNVKNFFIFISKRNSHFLKKNLK